MGERKRLVGFFTCIRQCLQLERYRSRHDNEKEGVVVGSDLGTRKLSNLFPFVCNCDHNSRMPPDLLYWTLISRPDLTGTPVSIQNDPSEELCVTEFFFPQSMNRLI